MNEISERVPDGCLCMWERIGSIVDTKGWRRVVPNEHCPVHFQPCPQCHGTGRVVFPSVADLVRDSPAIRPKYYLLVGTTDTCANCGKGILAHTPEGQYCDMVIR